MTSFNQAEKAAADDFSGLTEDACKTCGEQVIRPSADSVLWRHKATGTMFCHPEKLSGSMPESIVNGIVVMPT